MKTEAIELCTKDEQMLCPFDSNVIFPFGRLPNEKGRGAGLCWNTHFFRLQVCVCVFGCSPLHLLVHRRRVENSSFSLASGGARASGSEGGRWVGFRRELGYYSISPLFFPIR